MRHILITSITLFVLLAIGACTAEQPNTVASTPCEFTVAEHNTPQFATYANDISIPYNQNRLVQFMWVDLSQSECYAKQFAPVKIYRMPYTQNNGVFQKLSAAPTKAITSWNSFEVAYGSGLKGLTTFSFEFGVEEKIVESTMLVRSDASLWHLWHEFSHFIIGVERAGHHDQNLQIAEKELLNTQQNNLLKPFSNESIYSQQLQTFFNTNHEYIVKRFIDEMVIESTLVFLTSQTKGTPKVSDLDIQESINMILFFYMQFSSHTTSTLNLIAQLKAQQPLTQAQSDLVDMAEKRLLNQKINLDRMIHDVTSRARNSLFTH